MQSPDSLDVVEPALVVDLVDLGRLRGAALEEGGGLEGSNIVLEPSQ